jgi:hypothetical protein
LSKGSRRRSAVPAPFKLQARRLPFRIDSFGSATSFLSRRFCCVSSAFSPFTSPVSQEQSTIVISWPAPSTGFVLQQAPAVSASNWVNVPASPVVVGGQNEVTVVPVAGGQFYRLKK